MLRASLSDNLEVLSPSGGLLSTTRCLGMAEASSVGHPVGLSGPLKTDHRFITSKSAFGNVRGRHADSLSRGVSKASNRVQGSSDHRGGLAIEVQPLALSRFGLATKTSNGEFFGGSQSVLVSKWRSFRLDRVRSARKRLVRCCITLAGSSGPQLCFLSFFSKQISKRCVKRSRVRAHRGPFLPL